MIGTFCLYMEEKDIRLLWEKVPKTDSFWAKTDGSSYEHFRKLIQRSSGILLYPFGYIRLELDFRANILYAHGVFWSSSVFRSITSLKEDIQSLFSLFGVISLRVKFPEIMYKLCRFMTKLGFMEVSSGDSFVYEVRRK